ncbi:unnamed protein product [Bemisia tabaci]|uniref:Radical SAM core domain-containing protein n=1 Tax=Bemisia tabaci TaxID=7038 RepID=A0A9P0A5X5_BEMTA|nr:unnamed protein product [Bemisia tabaci]
MALRWSLEEALRVFKLPMADLMYQAQSTHRANFNPNEMQISTLLSIKTGACPENCSYCPQSAYYKTEIKKEPLMDLAEVVAAAKAAKEGGSTRFCMGAAWRGPTDRNLPLVCDMVKEVKKLGLETCVTLGLLKDRHAVQLKEAGLDFYNHNIDTSPEYYKKIISTRTFEDRIRTLEHVRNAGIKVCCGGILGMGENTEDRIKMLLVLANLEEPPESVPINQLIPIPGTPLADADPCRGHRLRADYRSHPGHDAQGLHPSLRRPGEHVRGDADALLFGGSQLYLLRREAPHGQELPAEQGRSVTQ